MAGRPTIADVAREAGVSVATVDRVLNGRHPVREETARKVYEAAHKIGYHAASVIKQRIQAELPEVHLGFILRKQKQAFYQAFAAELREAARLAAGIRSNVHITFANSQSPKEFSDLLQSAGSKNDVIAATCVDHHDVTDAVSALRLNGVPTYSLLSDFAQDVRESYVGLNNIKAGRIAAWTISKTSKPGKIAIFVGGHRWHGHALRETGFRTYFREIAPQFQILDTLVNLETRQITYEATLDLLARHPDLKGFYVAGGGMEGAIEAIREVSQPDALSVVVNEVTNVSRAALQDRFVTMVEATPLRLLCRDLIGLMINSVQNGMSDRPGQHFLSPDLYTPESL